MLPSKPSFAIGTNVFGGIWTAHKSLGSLGTRSRGHTPRFHTPRYVQRMEVNLDEHRRIPSMFQQAT